MSPPSTLPAWRTLTDTRTRRRSSPPPRPPEAPFAHHRPRRSINVIFACGPPQGPPQGELERQKRILAAVVRILLAMLRASGFSLAGERLPEGAAKDGILRAITSAKPLLPLAVILRMVHLEPGRYHAWNRRGAALACGLDDRSSCPRTSPSQLTPSEVATVKGMVLAPEYRHMPLGTLARYAQRIGKVFASASTWTKLVRERGWRRPRQRVHPPKPTVGVRASQPNQIWHIDTSVIKLLDGTKVYLQAVLDNYSRKILAWTVMERFAPSNTCQLLLAAGKHLVTASRPLLYADSGVENVNGAVDSILFTACLDRILAQVEVAFSNSLIEAYWRSVKHQWLFLNTLDSVARVRAMVEFHVNEHNTKMPHPAFSGQTPDEMFFGTGAKVPEELALARGNARAARMAANRAMSCERCLGQQATLPGETIPH